MAKETKRGLGKGLGALIATEENLVTSGSGNAVDNEINGILEIDINRIEPNKNQPRKRFDENALEELSNSIKEFGIIQPLIVSEGESGFYSIVAGERRWRAARLAKLKTVPVIVKKFDELETLQIALIENIQRQDLNPIEEALCYQKLSDIFFFRQEDIALKIGKSRATVSGILSLLKLDPRVQNFIIEGKLSSGHGRKLLDVTDKNLQFEFAERIIEEDLSIAQIGSLIEKSKNKEENAAPKKTVAPNPQIKSIESDLTTIFGTKVNLKDKNNKGKIEIEYYSADELDRILGLIKHMN
ncbi:ParB/RepB/Spo0J family partition protein [Tyzzerella sp. OttesenSCG-928-J15]|nr:ParB/RepB/Spo0J family partition protein [Tyzzerella sp. OttesenSCG-928-J15]